MEFIEADRIRAKLLLEYLYNFLDMVPDDYGGALIEITHVFAAVRAEAVAEERKQCVKIVLAKLRVCVNDSLGYSA